MHQPVLHALLFPSLTSPGKFLSIPDLGLPIYKLGVVSGHLSGWLFLTPKTTYDLSTVLQAKTALGEILTGLTIFRREEKTSSDFLERSLLT